MLLEIALAGNIMTLSYNLGLTTGSLVAYLLDRTIGSAENVDCVMMPQVISFPTTSTATPANATSALYNLTVAAATTVATTLSTGLTASTTQLVTEAATSTAASTLVAAATSVLNTTSTLLNVTKS